MTPAEHLDSAESALDAMDIEPSDLNYVPLHTLVAIGRFLQNIDSRQTQQAGS